MKSPGCCPHHPSQLGVGICASCLRERLLQLSHPPAEAPTPSLTTHIAQLLDAGSACDRPSRHRKATLRSLFDKDDAERSSAVKDAAPEHGGPAQRQGPAKHVVDSEYRFPAARDPQEKPSHSWLVSWWRGRGRAAAAGGWKQRGETANGECCSRAESVEAMAYCENVRPFTWKQIRSSFGGRPSWDSTRPSWDGPNTIHGASSLPPVSEGREVSGRHPCRDGTRSRDGWCNGEAGEEDVKEKEVVMSFASANHGACASHRDACTQTTPAEEEDSCDCGNRKSKDGGGTGLQRTWSRSFRSPICGSGRRHRRQESNPSWPCKEEYSPAQQGTRRWKKSLGASWLRFYLTPSRGGIASSTYM